ncbi:hypothetical protein HWV62_28459 [Athelia sp. TMB]|nr:hypothetical protein HWV62_28459 [Athelia sp. TMB]
MSPQGKNDGKKIKSSKKSCKKTGKKDRRVWTSSPEESYMKGCLPDFEVAQRNRDFSNFWPSLYTGYWKLFTIPPPKPADLLDDEDSEPRYESDVPMDSAEEEMFARTERGQLRAAEEEAHTKEQALQREKSKGLSPEERYEARYIRKRKKKKKATIAILPALDASAAPGRPSRINQEDEVYLHLFRDRIMPSVEKRIIDEDIKGPPINIIRQVARELYKDEDEQTRAMVAAELGIQTERKTQDQEKKKSASLNATEQKPRMPQDFQDAIDAFPQWVDAMLQGACDSTGFSASLLIGGPVPEQQGDIATISVHVGKNPDGNTFGTVYQKYQTAVVKPYTEFLRTVYPAEVRADRALRTVSAAPNTAASSFQHLEGATHTFADGGVNSPVPYVAAEPSAAPGPPPCPVTPNTSALTNATPDAAPDSTPDATPTFPEHALPRIPELSIPLLPLIPALRATEEPVSLANASAGAPSPSPRLNRLAQKASSLTEPSGVGSTAISAHPPLPRPKPRAAFKMSLLIRANEEAVEAAMPGRLDSPGNARTPSPIVQSPPSSLGYLPPVIATSLDALPAVSGMSPLQPSSESMNASPVAPPTACEAESSAALAAGPASVDAVPASSPTAPANARPAKRKKSSPTKASPAKRAKRPVVQSRAAKDIAQQEADKAAALAEKVAAKAAKAAAKEAKEAEKAGGVKKGNARGSKKGPSAK